MRLSKEEMQHPDPNHFGAYLDRNLGSDERDRVTTHLAECDTCRARLAWQVRAMDRLEGGEATSPADRERAFPPWTRHFLLLAAVLAALVVGYGLYRASDRGGPTATTDRGAPTAGEAQGGRDTRRPGGAPPAATAPPPSTEPARRVPGVAEAPLDPSLLALRGATKRVEGKTFRLEGGEWVDDAHEPDSGVKPVEIPRGSMAYQTALAVHPALARYADVGPRVVVVIDSIAYRILPAQ